MKSYCLSFGSFRSSVALHRPSTSATAGSEVPRSTGRCSRWIKFRTYLVVINFINVAFWFFAHSQKGQKSKKNFWLLLLRIEVITAGGIVGTVVEVKKVLSL